MGKLLALAAALALSACASYETTFLAPGEHGQLQPQTFAGVPIVVTRPEKIAFLATRSTYLVENPIVKDGQIVSVEKSKAVETTVDKTPITLGLSQVVTLDIKRPFFGTAETGMELSNQYPTKLSSKVDDKTLQAVIDAAEKFIQKQGAPISANASKTLITQEQFLIVYDTETGRIGKQSL